MSTSPEGVITWGGWAPKESIGHTWKNSLHCDQKDIVRKLSWNLKIYLSAHFTWALLVEPVIDGDICWVGWELQEVFLDILEHADVAGALLLGAPDQQNSTFYSDYLSTVILSSPIDALGAEPCLRQQGVRVALRPVRFLVVICKEECALATLEQ